MTGRNEMNTEKTKHEWIPSENELPPEGEQVVVTDGMRVWIDEIYCIQVNDEGQHEWEWDSGWDWIGTAWMPLPPLPKWKKEGEE